MLLFLLNNTHPLAVRQRTPLCAEPSLSSSIVSLLLCFQAGVVFLLRGTRPSVTHKESPAAGLDNHDGRAIRNSDAAY